MINNFKNSLVFENKHCLPISQSSSYFTVVILFHSRLPISQSSSYFTVVFLFHCHLPMSQSSSYSHFSMSHCTQTLHFTHALLHCTHTLHCAHALHLQRLHKRNYKRNVKCPFIQSQGNAKFITIPN